MKKTRFIICIVMLLLIGCVPDKVTKVTDNSPDSETDKKVELKETGEPEQSDLKTLITNVMKRKNVLDITVVCEDVLMITTCESDDYTSSFISISEKKLLGKTDYKAQGKGINQQIVQDYIVLYIGREQVVIINKDYEVEKNFVIKGDFLSAMADNFCVMPQTKRIIYWENTIDGKGPCCKVYFCNYKGKNRKQLLRLDGNLDKTENLHKLNSITSGLLSKNEKGLYFTGFYFDSANSGAQGKLGIGVLDLKSGKVVFHKKNKSQFQLTKQYAIFYEMPQYNEKPTGKIIVMSENGKCREIQFAKKEESENIFLSNQGSYVYSYVELSTMKDSIPNKCILTCYNVSDGKKIFRRQFDRPICNVFVFEKENVMIYSYYDNDTKLKIMITDMQGN